jgi:hypothetical protein
MADYYRPYKFSVYGVEFDVTFDKSDLPLEYNNYHYFSITTAYARKVGSPKTLAVKTIQNPKDNYSYIKGQKTAFQRIINIVWANWGMNVCGFRKDFSKKAWELSFDAGMWYEE